MAHPRPRTHGLLPMTMISLPNNLLTSLTFLPLRIVVKLRGLSWKGLGPQKGPVLLPAQCQCLSPLLVHPRVISGMEHL